MKHSHFFFLSSIIVLMLVTWVYSSQLSLRFYATQGLPFQGPLPVFDASFLDECLTDISGTSHSFSSQNINYTCSNCLLPSGISLNQELGSISGIPSSLGIFLADINASVSISNQSCTIMSMELIVLPKSSTSVNDTDVVFRVGQPSTWTPTSSLNTQSPFAVSYFYEGNLPPGLSFDSTSAIISGTPTHAGTFGNILIYGSDGVSLSLIQILRNVTVSGRDCDYDMNGPNGLGCGQGICVDEIEFDGQFTCDCSGLIGVSQPNCRAATPTPTTTLDPAAKIGLGVMGALLILLLLLLIFWFIVRSKKKSQVTDISVVKSNFVFPPIDEWEFDRVHLKVLGKLGQGQFGQVFLAEARNIRENMGDIEVALKTCGHVYREEQQSQMVTPKVRQRKRQVSVQPSGDTVIRLADDIVSSDEDDNGEEMEYEIHPDSVMSVTTQSLHYGRTSNADVLSMSQVDAQLPQPDMSYVLSNQDLKINDETRRRFVAEAAAMKRFNHDNVIRLLGVCMQEFPLLIITEFMHHGDLHNFLRVHHEVTVLKLCEMAQDISRGLAYLHSVHYVHGDLACRNCLIDDTLCVKISDFGFAKDTNFKGYYRRSGEDDIPVPVRWMAPESLTFGQYTKQSDVWSLGIVIWELMTHCEMPYPAMSNHEVFTKVSKGFRMSKPPLSPPSIYKIMTWCWDAKPDQRPSTDDVFQRITISIERGQTQPCGPNGQALKIVPPDQWSVGKASIKSNHDVIPKDATVVQRRLSKLAAKGRDVSKSTPRPGISTDFTQSTGEDGYEIPMSSSTKSQPLRQPSLSAVKRHSQPEIGTVEEESSSYEYSDSWDKNRIDSMTEQMNRSFDVTNLSVKTEEDNYVPLAQQQVHSIHPNSNQNMLYQPVD